MKKTTIIGIALVIIGVLSFVFLRGSSEQQVSKFDVKDTAGDFYEKWLVAAKNPEAEPNQKTLAKSPILSKTLREKLALELKKGDGTLDPVLCQTVVPESIASRTVNESAEAAQILVTSRDKKVTEQALVNLMKYKDGWYINDIQCSGGEFAPDKEFTFESEGFLLKNSIPAPFNKKDWHLVFEENGVQGNVVPIFFDKDSQCTSLDNTTATCKPDELTEATKASIHGQMTEYGVSVKKLQLVKE